MASFAGAARHLRLITALGFAGNPSIVNAASAPPSIWRNDLNWTDMTSKLSSSASLIDTSPENYVEECLPELAESLPSNHALQAQPSGMCLPHAHLGWETSWIRPSDNGHLNETPDQMIQDLLGWMTGAPADNTEAFGWMLDETNPSLNLPSKVLFPFVASDVVAAIQFAKEHGLEISVKNSGHSYQGASSKKNTLLLNMNQYTHYAPNGITDCDATPLDTTVAKDLSNQPCLLSLAKNKSSLIRVGGGENYDKAYRAVIAANQAHVDYKYHLTGGAAGTVSPMGWTWQGGNSGTNGGRLYGMGVDQVLQVEMVLPNGAHVKFGPTEWEDATADGFIVPRTTVVSGVCRSNPDEQDEEKWIWEDCPEDFDIDFGDLWFAVRGGGGGTWGVVTSVSLQLHDILPFTAYYFNFPIPTEECSAIAPIFQEFKAKYIMAPSLLNVTKERSLACGAPDSFQELYCYGEEDVLQDWAKFLERNNVDPADVACFSKASADAKSFAEMVLGGNTRFPDKVPDSPRPSTIGNLFANVLVPLAFIESEEKNIKTALDNMVGALAEPTPYYAFGGATVSASDQSNSLTQAHRDAAAMMLFFFWEAADEANFWGNLFPKMFDISDKDNFPPVFGTNHAGPLLTGPLKEDWTKSCPREWTFEERSEKCISFQEAIYGTEALSRLEAIKKAVDPQFTFNCQGCIGNNLNKASHKPSDQPSSKPGAIIPAPKETSEDTPSTPGAVDKPEHSGAFKAGGMDTLVAAVGTLAGSAFLSF